MSEQIRYYSTNLSSPKTTFAEALMKGLAYDGGLYMPAHIPRFSEEEIEKLKKASYPDIAFAVTSKFLQHELPESVLRAIVDDAYNFPVPLEHVYERKYIMRLDQGPTASFKDFAARMMGRLMNYYLQQKQQTLLILTATSGDTGSAIANAYYGLDAIQVVILFPDKEVTLRQRKQMTTLGKNVKVISIDGKFDDCQALVKQAFNDRDLDDLNLSSANSINIGRLIPQIVYYFYAYAQLSNKDNEEIIFSIPSGNFGNMMGCMLAKNMGLPIGKVIIATNENDEFPKLLETYRYTKIEPSKNCISSAMNVGHPSNLARLIALYGGVMNANGDILQSPDFVKMNSDIFSVSISDSRTREAISEAFKVCKVLLEPHGAVGWAALHDFLAYQPNTSAEQLIVSLETAHPAKFPEEINRILTIEPDLPESLSDLENKTELYETLSKNYTSFKSFLQEYYS